MLRKKILKDTLLLNVSSLAGQGLAMLQAVLVLRFLDPAEYGVWAGATIVLMYAGYSHLGMEYGLGVRLPYHVGREDSERAGRLEDTTFLAWTVLALAASGLVAGYALLAPDLTPLLRTALLFVAALVPLNQQILFLTRWRSTARLDFSLPSALAALQSALSLVLVAPLTYALGVRGPMLGTVLVAGAMVAVWWSRAGYRFLGRVDRELLREGLRFGFPILLVVLGGLLVQTADRLVILTLLGPASLGYYGVTSLGGSFLYGLLSQAGSTIAPHIAAELGRSADRPEALEKFLVKPTLVFAAATAALILGLVVVVPPLVHLVLPRYEPGIIAFYAYVPGFFFMGITLTANNALNVILIARGRQRISVAMQATAILIEVGAAVLLIRTGLGITGAALGSTLGFAFNGLAIVWLCSRYVLPHRTARVRFLTQVLSPFLLCTVLAGVVLAIGRKPGPAELALQLLVWVVACAVLVVWLERRAGLGTELRQAVRAWRARRVSVPEPAVSIDSVEAIEVGREDER